MLVGFVVRLYVQDLVPCAVVNTRKLGRPVSLVLFGLKVPDKI